jgi:hypothetical protein
MGTVNEINLMTLSQHDQWVKALGFEDLHVRNGTITTVRKRTLEE